MSETIASPSFDVPALLLISRCLPDRRGDGASRRAWDLLVTASESHRVWLVAAADRPIHLGQWKSLAAHAERLELAPGGPGFRRRARLAGTIAAWQGMTDFHTTLATSLETAMLAGRVGAELRLLDLGESSSLSGHAAMRRRWWFWPVGSARRTLAACDAVLTGPAPALGDLLRRRDLPAAA